jgi:glutaredoxin
MLGAFPSRKAAMTQTLSLVRSGPSPGLLALAAALFVFAAPSQAQFKVIGADGKVTYTDREPSGNDGRVTALGARGPAQAAEPDLPFDLRQVAAKYPVTLYTASGACDPCVQARQMLKQRGIPYSERQVVTTEDSDALERLAGSREVPTVTIGSQSLRGLASDTWTSYLDAAGYPRESRLPSSYQYRPAAPIVDRRDASASRTGDAATASRPTAVPATAAPAGPGGIRF